MSKFGAHVSIGKRDGIGAALKQCYDAGSPVPLLVSLDQDLWPDVQNYSPSTMLVFRTQPDRDDNPPEMYTGDPVVIAKNWYLKCKPKWQKNKAHFYAPTNERNPVLVAATRSTIDDAPINRARLMRQAMAVPLTIEQNQWCDEFDLAMMILADVDGFHLALHGDSVGTPDYLAWQHYQSSLAYASAHGHILLLHEYGMETTLQQAGPDLALRYRRVHDLTKSFASNLKIAIGECSGGAGYSGEGAAWLSDMEWYDSEAMKDDYLIGFAAYQLGGAENWCKLIPDWADYVMNHPSPINPPPPINESYNCTYVSYNRRITDAMGRVWYLDDPFNSDAGFTVLRDGTQWAGGYAAALKYYDHKVYAVNTRGEWYVTTTDSWARIADDPQKA